ncbi:MAG: hypothetical protein LQ338_007533, partial [Usnochroma carphineum]
SGSSFTEVDVEDEEEDPQEKEAEIREQEEGEKSGGVVAERRRHKHRHFKWTPNFSDVYQSVETSEPGNDGWAVKEGLVSVTPLKANFMHVQGLQGELKLSLQPHLQKPKIYAYVNYEDAYTHPIIIEALSSALPSEKYTLVDSADELPSPQLPFLQITSYETIPFGYLSEHPTTSLACSFIIRKALIRKHYLAHTVHSYLAKHADSELKDHVPLTIDFEVDYAEFLDEALVEAYELHEVFARNGGKAPSDREWWILKPSMSDRGHGIRLFSIESELHEIFQQWEQDLSDSEEEDEEPEASEGAFQSSHTKDEVATQPETQYVGAKKCSDGIITSQLRHFIAQPYIPPLLLPEYQNRKFHIRTYVLCVGALRVYVYQKMLALFAAVPYQAPGTSHVQLEDDGYLETGSGIIDMRPHLTNTCLQTTAADPLSANDSSDPKVLPLKLLNASALTPSTITSIHAQVFNTVSHVFRAAAAQPTTFQPLPNAFEIFGVDWLVDPDLRVHLLEFNAYPDFAQSGESGKRVVEELWRGALEIVLNGDGEGAEGFFGDLGGEGRSKLVEKETKGGEERWGMKKVLDLDMGRR